MNESREWVVIYEADGFRPERQEVSPWKPGDGLICTAGKGRASKVPCGRPAALLRIHDMQARGPQSRTYVCCANHLANKAIQSATGKSSSYGAPTVTQQADKAAREEVLAAHWDDYIAARERLVAETRDRWLSVLPEDLREAASAAIAADAA